LLKLPIESRDPLLEREHLCGELGDDASGDSFGGKSEALGLGGGEGLLSEGIGAFLDAAVSLG
jgi:hypothetical protein